MQTAEDFYLNAEHLKNVMVDAHGLQCVRYSTGIVNRNVRSVAFVITQTMPVLKLWVMV